MAALYYRIWTDAIVSEKAKKAEQRNWKLYTLIPISILMGINLLTFFYWMKVIVNKNLPLFFGVSIFSYKPINGFISVLITFILPFVIFNYLMIFSNDRYKKLMTGIKDENGKLYKKYVLFSLGILIIPILIKVLFFS